MYRHRLFAVASTPTLLLALMSLAGPVPAADEGDAAVAKKCFKCHGREGVDSEEGEPFLAGQSGPYVVRSLEAFRNAERPNKEMKRIAEKLNGADMEAVARYYSTLPVRWPPQPFDAVQAAKGARLHARLCDNCHVDGGRGFRMPENADRLPGPRLAGQTPAYLRKQFDHFLLMDRDMPRDMGLAMLELRPGDIAALVHYYASLAGRP